MNIAWSHTLYTLDKLKVNLKPQVESNMGQLYTLHIQLFWLFSTCRWQMQIIFGDDSWICYHICVCDWCGLTRTDILWNWYCANEWLVIVSQSFDFESRQFVQWLYACILPWRFSCTVKSFGLLQPYFGHLSSRTIRTECIWEVFLFC